MDEDKRKAFAERAKKEAQEEADHQKKMEKIHGLTGHPKAQVLYSLAWQMGHSSGYSEVECYYNDMAVLLK